MLELYVLTHHGVVGPLSGVELREIALAGVLDSDCVIAQSPEGPWYASSEIGLFSDKGVALPHPSDVEVSTYHVRGMAGAFQGPFKLRELVGFAVRGMLPIEAELLVPGQEDWMPVSRFRVLDWALRGEFALLDSRISDPNKRMVLLTKGIRSGENPVEEPSLMIPPMSLARRVDPTQATAVAKAESLERSATGIPTTLSPNPSSTLDQARQGEANRSAAEQGRVATRWSLRLPTISWWRVSDRMPSKAKLLTMAALACVAAVVAVSAMAWKNQAVAREDLIGHWVVADEQDDSPRFGISFSEDGQCVLFHCEGDSWTGDFVWKQRTAELKGASGFQSRRSVIDTVAEGHESGPILPSDGYLVLRGTADQVFRLDGHPITDLFIRRNGDKMRLGYLTEVSWKEGRRTMLAGWVNTVRASAQSAGSVPEVLADVDDGSGSIDETPGLALAIKRARSGIKQGKETLRESPAKSKQVDCRFLLSRFGMPDEARPVMPFERPRYWNGPPNASLQLVRYNDFVLLMSESGAVQYVRFVKDRSRSHMLSSL